MIAQRQRTDYHPTLRKRRNGFMGTKYKILIMGASYGSLLGTKLALAGHAVHLICLPAEADLINKEGAIVRMPVKGRDGLVEINSKKLPGRSRNTVRPACASCSMRWPRPGSLACRS